MTPHSHVSTKHDPVAHNRRAAVVYGAIIGVTLTACVWLAVACDIRRLWPEAQQEPTA